MVGAVPFVGPGLEVDAKGPAREPERRPHETSEGGHEQTEHRQWDGNRSEHEPQARHHVGTKSHQRHQRAERGASDQQGVDVVRGPPGLVDQQADEEQYQATGHR
jgi:hypothetical protein